MDVYIAVLGAEANRKALELVQSIRKQGFKAERDVLNRKLKAQFKSADVFNATALIALGGSEVEASQVIVKNNATRREVVATFEQIESEFSGILAKLNDDSSENL